MTHLGMEETASVLPDKAENISPRAYATGPQTGKLDECPDIEGYKIIEPLGKGGMGVVWRAEQLSTRRQVALKLLVSHRIDSAKAQARFQREVELTARLDHPNIARIYDSGLHHGMYYYAMELVDGISLDRYVKSQSLSKTQILALMQKVCQAVLYAHLRAVIHRDLKPSNIVVSPDGRPHILDFGLAKALLEEEEALTISIEGQVAGTPAYMSPEQAAGHHSQLDTRTDVYSLGVILYELLVGQSPHDLSGSMFDLLNQIAAGKIRRPCEIDKSIDSELEALLLKALALNPEDRYASAGTLAKDINNYLDEEPLNARVPTTLYFLRKKALKHKKQVGIAAAVLLIVFGTVLVAYTKMVGQQAVLRATEERNKSLETELADLRAAILSGDKDVAEAALRVLEDKYLDSQQKVEELLQKLGQQAAPAATKRIDLRQGEPLSPTALVRQPALPSGVKSWTLETIGHRDVVANVIYSPDGRWVASSSRDGTVRSWDSKSGQLRHVFRVSGRDINRLFWSSDSRRLMAFCIDSLNQISLWDIDSGKTLKSFSPGKAPCKRAVWSPDGRLIACYSPDDPFNVTLWNLETEEPWLVLRGHKQHIGAMAWSPDGRRLATGAGDGVVMLWDATTGRSLGSFDEPPEKSLRLVWSPDGRRIAVGGRRRSTAELVIRLWDTVSGRILSPPKTKDDKESQYLQVDLAWTPDGDALTFIDRETIMIWDVGSRQVSQLSPSRATTLAWSPDGKVLASGNQEGDVQFLDATSGENTHSHVSFCFGSINQVRFSPDGRFLATATAENGTVFLWDAHTWQPLYKRQICWSPSLGDIVMSWSPDSSSLAVGGMCQNFIAFLDVGSATISDRIFVEQPQSSCIAWSPDGNLLATGHPSGTYQFWQVGSRPFELLRSIDAHSAKVSALAWTLDSRRLFSAGYDGMIRQWNAETGELLRSLDDHKEPVMCLAVSPDGTKFVSGGKDDTFRLWDIQSSRSGRILTDTSSADKALHHAVAWSFDSTTLAAGSPNGDIHLWNSDTGEHLNKVSSCCGGVLSLGWSPAGRLLVCGGPNGTAQIFDVANDYQPYAVLLPLLGAGEPGMAVNPQGDYRGPPGMEEHLVCVVQTDSGQELLRPKEFAFRYGWVNEPWQVGLYASGSEKMVRIYVKGDAEGPYDGASWDTAFGDLQDALSVARPGTEIWAAAGVYKPDRGTGVREASFRLRNGVSVFGGFSGTETSRYQRDPNKYETILSGDLKGDDGRDFANNDENSYHVVTADEPVKSAVLDGFTVTGGNASGPQEDDNGYGGGMYNSRGTCALVDCTFVRNRASFDGGGISSWGSLAISNCTFSDNLARQRGGGLYCSGNETSVLTECIFTGNKAHVRGGGVEHRGRAGAIFIGCRFAGNSAPSAGGMHTQESFYTEPILINCAFYGNVASDTGGGMINRGSSPTLMNCIFAGNSADFSAGAMSNAPPAAPVLVNCTFIGNNTHGRGAGVCNGDEKSMPVLANCIFWGNRDDGQNLDASQINGSALINHCCVEGWSGKLGGTGNFGDDPLFVDPDGPDNRIGTGDDNLRLKPGSPCINAGDNAAIPADTEGLDDDGDPNGPIPFDFDRKPRIINGTVDLGAYESG
ncbi:MAG: protein kinase [Phycisphaerales bacterium]|nr:MAG: protein kinase [Phycisphaerales bacterium]